jgi:hypothetical protein
MTRIVPGRGGPGKVEEARKRGRQLDRQCWKVLPPFEHMLRSAIVHGIEAPPHGGRQVETVAST